MVDFLFTVAGVVVGFNIGIVYVQIMINRQWEENERRAQRQFATMVAQARIDLNEREKFKKMIDGNDDEFQFSLN